MAALTKIQQTAIEELNRLHNNPTETLSERAFQEAEKHEQVVKVLKEPLQPVLKLPVIGQALEIPVDFVLKGPANAHRYAGKVLQFFGFDEVEPGVIDFTSGQQQRDPLTGLQMSMTTAIHQDAEVRGNYAVDLMMGPEDFRDFDALNLVTIDSDKCHDVYNPLFTSDLPVDQEANAMTDLLPIATDPLA